MKRSPVPLAVLLPLVALTVVMAGSTVADAPSPLLAEYSVSGSSHYVAVESPGRIWFTLPNHNMIGRLIVTSTTEYQVTTYTVPTFNSEPYGLVYAAGAIWFTERAGNKIGWLDPTLGTTSEFTVPTSSSQPTSIDVMHGSPAQVWFTERTGNKLGQLVVTSTTDFTFAEYPLSGYPNAQLQDIYIQNSDSIWFTAPGVNQIGNFKPSYWSWNPANAFALVYTGGGSQPWAIKVDAQGYPWFTERAGSRIGQYFPTTLSKIEWYTLLSGSDPYDLDIAQGFVWFTERGGNRVGQLQPNSSVREIGLPTGSVPLGLAMDGAGCVWIADNSHDKIVSWCPPYFRFVYLPLVLRN